MISIAGPKVFCVGFNKTGTTSLSVLFENLGLTSRHDIVWPMFSKIPFGKVYFLRAQCFSDGEQPSFQTLHRWFPDAVFILNTRDVKGWLYSRIKHVLRRGLPPAGESIELSTFYGEMAKEFFADPEMAITRWICDHRIYETRVRSYFAGYPRFTEISVTDDPEWAPKLTDFLRRCDVELSESKKAAPPRANVRASENVTEQDELKRYLAIADRMLELLERPRSTAG